MALARNMSVLAMRPQPIQPGLVASRAAASPARPKRRRGCSPEGASTTCNINRATTTALAAKATGSLMPPKHILNAPTKLMKQIGYGAGYAYDHDEDEAFSGANYFPDEMQRQAFYQPSDRGAEAAVRERMERWAAIREKKARR